jgi:hypothetical protein
MLFFQADADDVCETSYKDRGGKYQGQTGVTLPRTYTPLSRRYAPPSPTQGEGKCRARTLCFSSPLCGRGCPKGRRGGYFLS